MAARHVTDDEPLTLREAAAALRVLAGLVLAVAAFLMVISAPAALYAWVHRDGYRDTEVVVEPSTRRYATVRVPASNETLRVRLSKFGSPVRPGSQRVLYNPQARLALGITLLDERIVALSDPRSTAGGIMPAAMAIGLTAAAFYVLRGRRDS